MSVCVLDQLHTVPALEMTSCTHTASYGVWYKAFLGPHAKHDFLIHSYSLTVITVLQSYSLTVLHSYSLTVLPSDSPTHPPWPRVDLLTPPLSQAGDV